VGDRQPNMHLLDLTRPTPEENLALDEALLDEAEAGDRPCEWLRLWEPAAPLVVVGRSSRVAAEVRVENCRRRAVPILRRSSGGAAIVTGPGCLMYALVLSLETRPALRAIDLAHQFVLDTIARALVPLALEVERRGTSDLALAGRKFSGNSLRVRRHHLLYHGTLLYAFPLELVADYLASPPRQPDYRAGRDHRSFITNLPVSGEALRRAVIAAWPAGAPCTDWPRERTAQLAADKFSLEPWNFRH
jgi:lipoate---protein ligase